MVEVQESELHKARTIIRKYFAGTSFLVAQALEAGIKEDALEALIQAGEVYRGASNWCEVRGLKPPPR
ncbi:MAG: hypothetical protein NXI24_20455 [bacterium]|nr:hypothetical protein [bacterium]